MDPETRRGIAQRALGRARAQGVALEDDQVFMALLDEWIEGKIPMRMMRERYFAAFAQRERKPVGRRNSETVVGHNQTTQPLSAEGDKKEGPSVETAAHEL